MLFKRFSSKLLVNFNLPHQSLLKGKEVVQVNLSTTAGDVGILANHVPTVLQLKPGFCTLIADQTQKYFVSGGFAVVNPDSTLNINAVEAYTLDDIDLQVGVLI
jgi:F-type H+-transporting ATPase subunit delta